MTKPIDRAEMKAQTRKLLQTAQVSPKGMTALYCACLFLLSLLEALIPGPELVSTFLSILTTLAEWILAAGFALYCMDIRRRERSEYAVLFDGFSFTGKIIALNIVINLFVFLWSMLFVFPGIIAYYRVFNGTLRKGDHVKFFNTGSQYDADEVGVLKLKMQPRTEIRAGDVGYICSGIKTSSDVKVGDTITSVTAPAKEAIAGFEDVKPMVFAGVYPVEADQYEDLRASLEKLQLNDASLTFEPESSLALGFGFRCGFLGLLHMEIIQERLYREFDMDVITTVPNVSYRITTTQGDVVEVHNPSGLPEVTKIAKIEEPYILAQIITKAEFLGNVIKLCIDKRGVMKNQTFITQDRVEVNFDMPLSEIVFDFYDKLKSISKGYASFDYHRTGYQPSKLVKLDILLNGEPVDALSSLTYTDHAYDFGRKMCEKLKELIPRQQFDIAIQAAIGAKIIARETVKAVRKDVTAKCYGGDISRKRKLLEKQKKGKKRMRQIGNVEVPQSAFLAVLKMD